MESVHENTLARLRGKVAVAGRARLERLRVILPIVLLGLFLILAVFIVFEARTSVIQSIVLHRIAAPMTWGVAAGPSDRIRFPSGGPSDLRRGYSLLPAIAESLSARGLTLMSQARMSPRMVRLADRGFYPIFPEKAQAGLTILDRDGRPMYAAAFPEQVYPDFEAIPPLVVRSLLYIENRNLLEVGRPSRNPAVEWDRLIKASLDYALNHVGFDRPQPGGSTLATQLEKFRHSPGGRTGSAGEKFRQMVEASLRSYQQGRTTAPARRQIILDYVNAVPLAARPGYGEITGLKDGLRVWYGRSPDEVDRLLRDEPASGPALAACAQAYREVLGLFISQRRPSFFLVENPQALEDEVDHNLRVLERGRIISPVLAEAARHARLKVRNTPAERLRPSFAETKATSALRSRLLWLTGLSSFYELDRLDLMVESTLDRATQRRVTRTLLRVGHPGAADSLGLLGENLLSRGDPAGVIFSFNLYERTPQGNVLRVQTDNLDEPLDINEGVKLELGSTAKLRTLCNYLEIVGSLHAEFAGQSRSELRERAADAEDPIRRWAWTWLASSADTTLTEMLDAALLRTYSGSPGEAFYTGGGLHTFSNFKKEEDYQSYSVREGLVHSVNLVYIRLMRDIVRYYRAELPAFSAGILKDADNPARQEYLARFADKEGKQFLWGFYKRYHELDSGKRLRALVEGIRPTPKRLAVIYRSVRPEADFSKFASFLERSLPAGAPPEKLARDLYDDYAKDRYDLQDRGYLAHVHPLELWLLEYLESHPGAKWTEVAAASTDQRQEAYTWLFKGRKKRAQDKRIGDLLEVEAFERIHAAWKKLGYPFDHLVPSYATAIGSSADKPAALAALMGILVNDGVRLPMQRMERLHFASATPYETVFESAAAPGERVMRPEAARLIRDVLCQVVERGTARRVAGAFHDASGEAIPVGGKTGTGDNRSESYGPGGRLISSRVINRTATFVFEIGDRFFGTVTAHVNGPKAQNYEFTSALPVQMLKVLAPDLQPLITGQRGENGAGPAETY